jgi:hypothetical protein
MMKRMRTGILLLLACMVAPASTLAQEPEPPHQALRPLRIAKWGALATAAGAAVYGFVQNHRADDRFNQLEQLCQDQPVRCSVRGPGGAYQDPEFEELYGEVRSLDRRAHAGLLLGQIGVAATVAFFLLDLDKTRRPPDIPFVPSANLESRDDGSLALTFVVPLPKR